MTTKIDPRFTRSEIIDSPDHSDKRFTLAADGRIIATVYITETGELMPSFEENTPEDKELFAHWCSYQAGRLGPISRTPLH